MDDDRRVMLFDEAMDGLLAACSKPDARQDVVKKITNVLERAPSRLFCYVFGADPAISRSLPPGMYASNFLIRLFDAAKADDWDEASSVLDVCLSAWTE